MDTSGKKLDERPTSIKLEESVEDEIRVFSSNRFRLFRRSIAALVFIAIAVIIWQIYSPDIIFIKNPLPDGFRNFSIIAASIFIALMIIGALWFLPRWQIARIKKRKEIPALTYGEQSAIVFEELTDKEKFLLENQARKTWALIICGILFLGFFGAGIWKSTRENAEKAQKITDREQLKARFIKSIEQLESKQREVRVGGIYGLSEIAESDPDNYHMEVMGILATYVRENAPDRKVLPDKNHSQISSGETGNGADNPPVDIQAALTAIGQRFNKLTEDQRQKLLNMHQPIDLRNTNLKYIKLAGSSLRDVNFQGANLSGADLLHSDLSEANLSGTDLSRAYILAADLSRANLRDAHLYYTDLRSADLSEASISGADFSGADLRQADLSYCANLLQQQIDRAITDRGTKLPYGLTAAKEGKAETIKK